MCETTKSTIEFPAPTSQGVLSDILRQGAQQMLATAIEDDVAQWIAAHEHVTDETGHRQVVRNGHFPKQSWKELLLSVKQRGLTVDLQLATGDGALGFWKALPQVFPKTKEQHGWVHKTANVLDKLPKRSQSGAKELIHPIWMAETRQHAGEAFDLFLKTYEAKYPKAAECLGKDRDVLLAFYDFPAEPSTAQPACPKSLKK